FCDALKADATRARYTRRALLGNHSQGCSRRAHRRTSLPALQAPAFAPGDSVASLALSRDHPRTVASKRARTGARRHTRRASTVRECEFDPYSVLAAGAAFRR